MPSAFGSYRVLHQAGSGVLGPVFRAFDTRRDRLVAIKAFALNLPPEQVASVADALRRVAATPVEHPGLVPIFDVGVEGTTPFIVMEYQTGETLDVALRAMAPANLDVALPLLSSLADAIDQAALDGLGHGALHPRDVFVGDAGNVRVTGCGIARALEEAGVKTQVRRPYAAPERVDGRVDLRADVYSVGVIAHELLTRRRPLGPGEQDGELAPGVRPEQRVQIRRVLAVALAESPDERFQSAVSFVRELEAVAKKQAVTWPAATGGAAAPASMGGPQRRRSRQASSEPPPLLAQAEASAAREREEAGALPEVQAVAPVVVEAPTVVPAPAATAEPDIQIVPVFAPRAAERPTQRSFEEHGEGNKPTRSAAAGWTLAVGGIAAALVLGVGLGHFVFNQMRREPAPAVGAPAPPDSTVRSARAEPPKEPAAPPAASSTSEPAPATAPEPPPAAAPAPPVEKAEVEKDVKPAAPRPREETPRQPIVAARTPIKKPATGTLVLRSAPSGALITIDGRLVGETPATIRDLAVGPHTVRIAKPGHTPFNDQVTLAAAAKTINVDLERALSPEAAALGSIDVDSRPRGARVTVDGRFMGHTPLRVPQLKPASYRIAVELGGYHPATEEVVVVGGKPSVVRPTLRALVK